ncbi:MAG: polyvinylalcohol dehydrogenase, partial [Candidatus Acidiferrum sp.]
RYDQTGKGPANSPTPVTHESLVYSGGGRSGYGALVRLKGSADGVAAEQVYYERGLPVSIGGSVLVGDYLYGTNGKALVCVEFATGKIKWEDKTIPSASVCQADGCIYVFGDNDEVALIQATADGYHEKGRFKLPDMPKHKRGEVAWAYPVIANGKLYLRDLGSLWCYDIKGAK